MELPNQEGDMQMQMQMPLPLNSAYGGGHTHSHGHVHHMIHHDPPPASSVPQVLLPAASNNGPIGGVVVSSSISNHEDQDQIVPNYKKISVKYKECLKNHAASMGGNATDGCGEFMPSGEEGTLEALTCSACNCHRNFHRKEIDGDLSSNYDTYHHHHHHHPSILSRAAAAGRKMIMGMGHHHKGILGTDLTTGALVPSRVTPAPVPPPHHHHPMSMIMSYNMGSMPSESDEQEGGVGGGGGGGGGGVVMTRPPTHHMVKKRYRTKFTQEQKEKMFNFAEKSGWKIQKQEESVVQQFCQEIGVRRRVLKVWMHNNKHNLTKKNNSSDAPNQV